MSRKIKFGSMRKTSILICMAMFMISLAGISSPSEAETKKESLELVMGNDFLASHDVGALTSLEVPGDIYHFIQDGEDGGIVIPEYTTVEEVADAVADVLDNKPVKGDGWQSYLNWILFIGVTILGIAAFIQRSIIGRLKQKTGVD